MRPDDEDGKRVEIESDNPPRPDDTDKFLRDPERRVAEVKAAAARLASIRDSRPASVPTMQAVKLPPRVEVGPPALPVPDVVFGEVVEATPTARGVVLVVDDDDDWLGIWRRGLARDGVELHLAKDRAEGLALVDSFRTLAIAVLDWKLPNGEGTDIAEAIVAKFPSARIIVSSGFDSVAHPNEQMRARFRAAAPKCVFHPKQVAAEEVRRGLRELEEKKS